MISVIICHKNKFFLDQIKKSIAATIGTDYELIVIDNTGNQYSLFQAYNRGAELSNGNILCFTHEDLIFHTQGWGRNVHAQFNDSTVGLIGICGGNALPACPAPWWNSTVLNEHFANNISTWPGKESVHDYKNPYGESASDCLVVDGAWFCIRKGLFEKIRFDDVTYQGFHFYDLDICMQVIMQQYKVRVAYDVLLEHFSPGSINKEWALAGEKFADKWAPMLPLTLKKVNDKTLYNYSVQCLLTYAYWIRSIGYSESEIKPRLRKYLKRMQGKKYNDPDALLLYYWQFVGYKVARAIIKPLKLFK